MDTNPKTIKAGPASRCEPSVWSSAFTRVRAALAQGPAEGRTPNGTRGVTHPGEEFLTPFNIF